MLSTLYLLDVLTSTQLAEQKQTILEAQDHNSKCEKVTTYARDLGIKATVSLKVIPDDTLYGSCIDVCRVSYDHDECEIEVECFDPISTDWIKITTYSDFEEWLACLDIQGKIFSTEYRSVPPYFSIEGYSTFIRGLLDCWY
ncbi:MAG: hypothetical protein ACRCXZ_00630 [Patescibacteria group bacterium]